MKILISWGDTEDTSKKIEIIEGIKSAGYELLNKKLQPHKEPFLTTLANNIDNMNKTNALYIANFEDIYSPGEGGGIGISQSIHLAGGL